MSENQYILTMRGITKQFPGVLALDHADLLVKPGTVHALLGENGAGKSTLMKCLFGIYKMDSGEIVLNGQSVNFQNPRDALDHGISMVHQELDQVPERSVLDNLWLGRYPHKWIFVQKRKMEAKTRKLFDEYGVSFNMNQKLEKLSVSNRQLVDIIKAVSYNAKVIVLDEPTSSLTSNEVQRLFDIIRKLKAEGTSIIYISHKLEEIKQIADEVTIMRDGCVITTQAAQSLSIKEIINYMVGRSLTQQFPPRKHCATGEVVLEAQNLSGEGKDTIADISFTLQKGEILGIAGLLGSRRTELLETLYGMRQIKSGVLLYKGVPIQNKNSTQAIRRGFAFLTEERRYNGIFPEMNLRFNTVIASIKHYKGKIGLLDNRKIAQATKSVIDSLRVKTPNQLVKIRSLSGGNQQKLLFGRWLLTHADIMLLDDPTRGIDVGAKYEIYQLMINLAQEGKSILFVSSEMPELLGVADRILVLSNGRTAGVIDVNKDPERATQEHIMTAAGRYL